MKPIDQNTTDKCHICNGTGVDCDLNDDWCECRPCEGTGKKEVYDESQSD